MKRNSGLIGLKRLASKTSPGDAGLADLHDQHMAKLSDSWPETKAISSVSFTAAMLQNSTYTVNVNGVGWDAGAETLYWTLDLSAYGTNALSTDFASTSGSFTMATDGTGSFNINTNFTANRYHTNISRNFRILIRRGSTSGEIVYTTSNGYIAGFTVTSTAGLPASTNEDGSNDPSYHQFGSIGTRTAGRLGWIYGNNFVLTGISGCLLEQGIGLQGADYYYKGFSTNKSNNSTGYMEFTVRGWNAVDIVGSIQSDSENNYDDCRILKNGVLQYEVNGPDTDAASTVTFTLSGCTHNDVIRFEYFKDGSANRYSDEGRLLYLYATNGSGVVSGVADASDISAEVSNAPGNYYSVPTITNTFVDNMNPIKDYTTEGTELWYAQGVAQNLTTNKWHQVWQDIMTINDTSATPVVTISESTTSITENDGVGVTFTVQDTGNPTLSDTYYYAITGTGITAADFTDGALTGSFSMNDVGSYRQGTINKQAVAENSAEGESFQLEVRTGSTSGTLRATSQSVSIVDATVTTADLYLDFYESRYGINIGTINVYLVDATTGALVSGSLYSASGNNGVTTWYNRQTSTYTANVGDSLRWAISHLAGSSFRGDYAVDFLRYYKNNSLQWTENWVNTNGDVGQWVYGSTAGSTSSSSTAFANQANVILSTAAGNGKWNIDSSGTSSGSTGPTSAYSGTYYAYTETTSFFSQYHWMFSPSFTV